MGQMIVTGRCRLRDAVLIVLAASILLSPAAAASEESVRRPRFFVPDFSPGDGKDESSWVALAVSEGLRARLRRSGVTEAVSGTRTAGVLQRMVGNGTPNPEQIVRTARLLGADWTVMGVASVTDEGEFALKVRARHVKQPERDRTGSVQASSLRALLENTTNAALELTGIELNEAQQKRISATPEGSDTALEYYAKAVRAVRASKPNDALFYVAQSRRHEAGFRPTLRLLGQINVAAGNQREVLLVFESLLRRAKLADDPVDVIFALTQIAIAHQRLGRADIAEEYYRAAQKEARRIGLRDYQAVLFGAIATLRVDQRKSDEAVSLLQERLKLLEQLGDRLALGPACMTLGLVYAAKKDTRQAVAYLSRSVKHAEEVDIPADKASALFQIGELHKEAGELDEALKAYQASIVSSKESEAGSAYRQMAEVYDRQGDLAKALEMLRKAESILSGRRAYAQQADCLARIARIHAKRNDHAEAVDIMAEAVEILSDLGHPELDAYKKELAEMQAKHRPK